MYDKSIFDKKIKKMRTPEWRNFLRTIDSMTTGEKVKLMRKKIEMTQTELAHVAHCSLNVISQIEKGMNCFQKEMLYFWNMSRFFGVTIDWLTCNNPGTLLYPQNDPIANCLHIPDKTADALYAFFHGIEGKCDYQGLEILLSTDTHTFNDLLHGISSIVLCEKASPEEMQNVRKKLKCIVETAREQRGENTDQLSWLL